MSFRSAPPTFTSRQSAVAACPATDAPGVCPICFALCVCVSSLAWLSTGLSPARVRALRARCGHPFRELLGGSLTDGMRVSYSPLRARWRTHTHTHCDLFFSTSGQHPIACLTACAMGVTGVVTRLTPWIAMWSVSFSPWWSGCSTTRPRRRTMLRLFTALGSRRNARMSNGRFVAGRGYVQYHSPPARLRRARQKRFRRDCQAFGTGAMAEMWSRPASGRFPDEPPRKGATVA